MLATYRLISKCIVSTRETQADPLIKRTYERSGLMLFLAGVSAGRFARRCNEFVLTADQLESARKLLQTPKTLLREQSEVNRLAAAEPDLLPASESTLDSDLSGNDLMQSADLGKVLHDERLRLPLFLYEFIYPSIMPSVPPPPRDVGKVWLSSVPLQYGSAKFNIPYEATLIAKLPDNPLFGINLPGTPMTFPGAEVSLTLNISGSLRMLASSDDGAPLASRGAVRMICDATIVKFGETSECRILDYQLTFAYHRIPARFDDEFVYLGGCDPAFSNPYAAALETAPPPASPSNPATNPP